MAYNIFERWPFTSFQNLNLDWILKITKKAGEDSTAALAKAQTALDTTAGFSERVDQIGQQASAAETTAGTALNTATNAATTAESAVTTANAAASQVDAAFDMASNAQQAADAAQTSASTAYSAAVTAGQNAQTGITNAAAAQTAADNAQTTANTALSNANEALNRLATAVGVYEYTLTGAAVYDKGGLPASSAEMIEDMSNGVMPLLKDSSTGEIYLPVDVDSQQIKFFSPHLVGGSVAIQNGYLVTVGTNGSASKTLYTIGASGGSGVFLITATYDSTNQKYSFNKSAAEITAAIGSNMLPIVQIYSEIGSQYDRLWFVFTHSSFDGEDTYFNFVCLHDVGLIRYMQFVVSESRAVIYNRAAVPAATSQDEGKILRVNSFGNYQLTAIPAAENTSFGT